MYCYMKYFNVLYVIMSEELNFHIVSTCPNGFQYDCVICKYQKFLKFSDNLHTYTHNPIVILQLVSSRVYDRLCLNKYKL